MLAVLLKVVLLCSPQLFHLKSLQDHALAILNPSLTDTINELVLSQPTSKVESSCALI